MVFRLLLVVAMTLAACSGQKVSVKSPDSLPLPFKAWKSGEVVANLAVPFSLRVVSDTTQSTLEDTLRFTVVAEVRSLPVILNYDHLIFGGSQEIRVLSDSIEYSILERVQEDTFIGRLLPRKHVFLTAVIFRNGQRVWVPPLPPPSYRWKEGQEIDDVDLGYCRLVFISTVKQSGLEDKELNIAVKVLLVSSHVDMIEIDPLYGEEREFFIKDSKGAQHKLVQDIRSTDFFPALWKKGCFVSLDV